MSGFSRFKTEYTVRPDDIDMFQHVHNSKYFDYVLAARYDQMRDYYGMTMEDFMADGFGWVVRTAHVNYKRAMRMGRSEEHMSELQSLMRISYAVFCLKKKKTEY